MATYDVEVDVVEDNISNSDLDTETQNAINDALNQLGDDGGVTIEELTGDDTSDAADAELVTSENPDGAVIGDTDASIILAGDGSGGLDINITSSNDEGERTIVSSGESDRINIESDDNASVEAGDGDDSVSTGGGNDSLGGGAGNDSINSGAGSDSIEAGSGSDSVDGGEGFDEVIYTAPVENFFFNEDGSLSITNIAGETSDFDNIEYISTGIEGGAIIVADSEEEAEATGIFAALYGETASKDEFINIKDSVDSGQSIEEIIETYITAEEFQQATAGSSDTELVAYIFDNIGDSGNDVIGSFEAYLDDILNGRSIDRKQFFQDVARDPELLEALGYIGIDTGIV